MKAATDDELPEGWFLSNIRAASEAIQYGYTASARHDGGIPKLLRITDIQNGRVDWDAVPSCAIDGDAVAKYQLDAGDIVFARTGATTGKSFLIRDCPIAVFASYLVRLRPSSSVLPEFLSYFFQTPQYWQHISDNVAGNAQPNCNASKLAELPVPIPPLAEQRRIVAKVEELLARVNAARDRLAKVPAILRRFRQSILAAACSGQLTADWRESTHVERADRLLHRIATERQRVRKNAKKTSGTEPTAEELHELPETWAWGTLSQIGQEGRPIIYGIIKPGPHFPDGVPYVRVTEMKDGFIDVPNLKRASHERAAKFARATLAPGDLLISKDGTIGRVAVVPPEPEGGNITQHLVRAAVHPLMDRDYVVTAVRSPVTQKWLTDEKLGVALQGVNVEDFRRLPVPVPPAAEQHEIVRRLTPIFALADKIEARVHAAKARVDKITQAILAKAFRGELVETEAELARRENRPYEPASALLDRIRAERAATETASTPRRVRKAAQDSNENSRDSAKRFRKRA